MLTLTEAAARRILEAIPREAADEEVLLRVAAARRDDGSIEYALGWDEQREGDELLEASGVSLVVGSPSRALLEGMAIDWADLGGGESCFVFVPVGHDGPDAGSCGSGSGRGCGGCGGGGCA